MNLFLLLILGLLSTLAESQDVSFLWNSQNLSCYGVPSLWCLGAASSSSSQYQIDLTPSKVYDSQTDSEGLALYKDPIPLSDAASGKFASFETNFSFKIRSDYANIADGMTFVMLSTPPLNYSSNTSYGGGLGVYSETGSSFGNQTSTLAVEFDVYKNLSPINDIDNHHVGIDTINATSLVSKSTGDVSVNLTNGATVFSWIKYDAASASLEVSVSNYASPPPTQPLINLSINLTELLGDIAHVGFSAASGADSSVFTVIEWSFASSGLPPLAVQSKNQLGLILGLTVGALALITILLLVTGLLIRKRAKRDADAEKLHKDIVDSIAASLPHQFAYKQLSDATGSFSQEHKLGSGGFGSVYKGYVASTQTTVAVKRLNPGSSQGEREFLAEISTISNLQHRNLVRLLGWCKEKGKYLLVYEYMPNGSLDKAITAGTLDWPRRFHIVRGLAAALHFLHEGLQKQVVHRDVKPSNVMLDNHFNAKLGDFGLARSIEHEHNGETTVPAGTFGYMAPESLMSGSFTDKSDVHAFGILALETACCRKPVHQHAQGEEIFLANWVWFCAGNNDIMSVVDKRLEGNYDAEQMKALLIVGLICSQPDPTLRPPLAHVVRILAGEISPPHLPSTFRPRLVFSTQGLDGTSSSSAFTHGQDSRSQTSTSDENSASLEHRPLL